MKAESSPFDYFLACVPVWVWEVERWWVLLVVLGELEKMKVFMGGFGG